MAQDYPVRVGELRPSQLLWAFGPGSLVDLPQFSATVLGLDYWRRDQCVPIPEGRLLHAVRRVLCPQVEQLLAPPVRPDTGGSYNPFSAEAGIGVPVAPFPRWLRCSLCGTLAEYDSGLFELKSDPYRPDRTRFVHHNCDRTPGRPPQAVAARFLVACRNGHLDDFPWHWFVHRGQSSCPGKLRFYEVGASLQTENLWAACGECDQKRSLVEAFGDRGREALPGCRGHHPHLGRFEEGCDQQLRAVLLGASNSWFPVSLTLLSIPTKADKLSQLVEDRWDLLSPIPSREVLGPFIESLSNAGQLPGIQEFDLDDVWEAIQARRGSGEEQEDEQALDFKSPEWDILTSKNPPSDWPDFMTKRVDAPSEFRQYIDYVVLLERLREVNALIGFTRVEPPEEAAEEGERPMRAALARSRPTWVPSTEVRGEGIFIRFNEDKLHEWLKRSETRTRMEALLRGHKAWRAARKLEPIEANFPGILYVLLHSFAHVLLRELSLECGYNAASIRERVYATEQGDNPGMAGVLLYTAAPDSDGTLGGLVDLGKPENLGRLIHQALERCRVCSSDPLCAEHAPTHDRTLHGSACHACSFVPETSCEVGNKYLDRSLLVPTLEGDGLAFFD